MPNPQVVESTPIGTTTNNTDANTRFQSNRHIKILNAVESCQDIQGPVLLL